jgi:hypothetical protein
MLHSPRGAAGHVLAFLTTNAVDGRYSGSLLTIAIETGYSMTCVARALRQLQADYWVTVVCPGGPCRPACYELVPQVARVVGLLDRIMPCSA